MAVITRINDCHIVMTGLRVYMLLLGSNFIGWNWLDCSMIENKIMLYYFNTWNIFHVACIHHVN